MKRFLCLGIMLMSSLLLHAMEDGPFSPLKKLVALRLLEGRQSEDWYSPGEGLPFSYFSAPGGVFFELRHFSPPRVTPVIIGAFMWHDVSSCGRYISVAGGHKSFIQIVSSEDLSSVATLQLTGGSSDRDAIGQHQWSRDSRELLIAGFDGMAHIWDIETKTIQKLPESGGTIRVQWHPKRDLFVLLRRLASGDQAVQVELWESITRRRLDAKTMRGEAVYLGWNTKGDQLGVALRTGENAYVALDGVCL